MNPALIIISFFSSITLCGILIGIKKIFVSLAYGMPMLLIIAVTNPIFVHKGETILFFLNDNPVTKEAIIYGLFAAMMLISVFYWFKCLNEVMTSDKFIYLFGRIIPKFALVLSMALKFIPELKRQYKNIDESRKALGIYTSKSYVDKIKNKLEIFSVLITWSLEKSIGTGDSMKARGYGLKGRTSYSLYKWTEKDTFYLAAVLSFTVAVLVLLFNNTAYYSYYPLLTGVSFSAAACVLYCALFVLTAFSSILILKENLKWQYLKSKI